MKDRPLYRHFQEEKDDDLSQKIFTRFVVIFFVVYILLMVAGYVFYQNFSYVTISGRSMQSTLNPNAVAVKTKEGTEYLQDGVYIKRTQNVDYQDIVVIESTQEYDKEEKTIIKRVIALEGDYVTIVKLEGLSGKPAFHVLRVKSGSEKVEVLEEDYIYSYDYWSCEDGSSWEVNLNGVAYETTFFDTFRTKDYQTKTFYVEELNGLEVVFFKVPEDNIFFLGDNRTGSKDSRAIGCYNISKIEGRVVDVVRDGSAYKGNDFWWFNRTKGFFRVVWKEILYFFGANA